MSFRARLAPDPEPEDPEPFTAPCQKRGCQGPGHNHYGRYLCEAHVVAANRHLDGEHFGAWYGRKPVPGWRDGHPEATVTETVAEVAKWAER